MGLRRNKKLKMRTGESGGPGPRGLWARSPEGLGNLSNYDFSQTSRWERLKRLLGRWGPGGKRSPPQPPTIFWGRKGERKRVFTLSAIQRPPKVGGLGVMVAA